MRVTQGMLNSNMLNYLNANNTRMSKYQEMLASGQKLNRPSDDPVAVGYAMRYTEQISRNDQYQRNIDAAMSNLDFLDTSLNQVNEVLKRARELAVRATTESMSIESRQAVAKEIHQLHDQLVGIGNTQFNGQYIFNGQKTDVQPYNPNDTNAMYDAADPGQIHYAVSDGITIPVNVSGERLFGSKVTPGNEATSDNVFAIMAQLEQDLLADNQAGISASLDKLDSRTSKVLDTWAEIGARGNRVEMLQNRVADLSLNLETLRSKTVDADIPETIMNLKMAENVQNASLSVGASIIKPTLVDFLR